MTIEDALRLAVVDAARGSVTIPPDLHGFPGTAHGGAVAAVFHRLTLPRPPVELHLKLLRGVPTGQPLRLETGSTGATARLALRDGERLLVEATLRRPDVEEHPSSLRPAPADAPGAPGDEVPGTATCVACGHANPLGLGVRFRVTPDRLWRELEPPPAYRGRGFTHPALALILLDELGWWLGALAQGECGVTTDVRITLHDWLPPGPLLAVGDRTTVRADEDPRGRYTRAGGVVLGADGAVLASADVQFAGSRAYTRRLLEPFLATTPREALTRWFPSAEALSARQARP